MNKSVAVLLACCLTGAVLVPRCSLFSGEYDAFFSMVENQPVVQFCSAVSVIPVEIVTRLLFSEDIPSPQRPRGHSGSQNKHRAGTPAEYTLVSQGAGAKSRGFFTLGAGEDIGTQADGGLRCVSCPAAPPDPGFAGNAVISRPDIRRIPLLVNLLRAIRPRGDILPAGVLRAALLRTDRGCPTRIVPGRVFYVPGSPAVLLSNAAVRGAE